MNVTSEMANTAKARSEMDSPPPVAGRRNRTRRRPKPRAAISDVIRSTSKSFADVREEIHQFYLANNYKATGESLPHPFINYSNLKNGKFYLFYHLLEKLEAYQKLSQPTPVQALAIPLILYGKNVCFVSKRSEDRITGYLMGALMFTCFYKNRVAEPTGKVKVAPMVVILAPVSEMCVEIEKLATRFGDYVSVKNSILTETKPGEAKPPAEKKHDRKSSAEIVIATPKRFLDAVLHEGLNLDRVKLIIFDEIDKMFDLGYYAVLNRLMPQLEHLDTVKMSAFCSTLPLDVRIFNEQFMADTGYIQVFKDKDHLLPTPLSNVQQNVNVVRQEEKENSLFKILRGIYKDGDDETSKKTVVFIEPTLTDIKPLGKAIAQRNYNVIVFDDRDEYENQQAQLLEFKKIGANVILLMTNRQFRGPEMRFSDVNCVVNYDLPQNNVPEAGYIHQVGRAGLLETPGVAWTFLTSKDASKAQEIIDILKESNQDVQLELYDLACAHMDKTKIPTRRLTLFDILSDTDMDIADIVPENNNVRNRSRTPKRSTTRKKSRSRSPIRIKRSRSPVRRRSRSPIKRRTRSPIKRRTRSRSRSRPRRRQYSRSPEPVPELLVPEVSPEAEALREEILRFYYSKRKFAGDTYEDFLPQCFIELLVANGFPKLTALQSQVFSSALEERDLLVITKPSSPDRILSYLVPAIIHIIRKLAKKRRHPNADDGPIVIIVVPTVEMVNQVHRLAKIFCENFEITEIAISTPKSFAEMLSGSNEHAATYVARCDYVIFDEIHEMLDGGYIEEVGLIHRRSVSNQHQWQNRLVFSSQFTVYERMFSKDFLHPNHPVINMMDTATLGNRCFACVKQFVDIILNEDDKRSEMSRFLERVWRNKTFAKTLKVVIFVASSPSPLFVTKVQSRLPSTAPKILCLPSDRRKEERAAVLKQFNAKHTNQILIVRDTAGDEIDLTDVKLVINFEYLIAGKYSAYYYLHRVSQTDRSSSDRFAISYLTLNDARKARQITTALEQMNQPINPLLHDLTTFEDTEVNHQTKDLIRKIFVSKPVPTVGNSVALLSYLDEKYPKPLPHPSVVEVSKKVLINDPVASVSALVNAVQRSKQTKIVIEEPTRPSGRSQPTSTTTTSVSIESSSHSYHATMPPKVIINNQFINTNLSTFTATGSHFFNPENPHSTTAFTAQPEASKDPKFRPARLIEDNLSMPPSPPKVDSTMLQMLKKASINLKRSQQSQKEAEERKKYKKEEEKKAATLTDSVSSFLEKLTNNYRPTK